jgi:hypothetical protein
LGRGLFVSCVDDDCIASSYAYIDLVAVDDCCTLGGRL